MKFTINADGEVQTLSELYHSALYHHGIKGQKWGVRRFQNKNGTLTPEGKERYGKNSGGDASESRRTRYTIIPTNTYLNCDWDDDISEYDMKHWSSRSRHGVGCRVVTEGKSKYLEVRALIGADEGSVDYGDEYGGACVYGYKKVKIDESGDGKITVDLDTKIGGDTSKYDSINVKSFKVSVDLNDGNEHYDIDYGDGDKYQSLNLRSFKTDNAIIESTRKKGMVDADPTYDELSDSGKKAANILTKKLNDEAAKLNPSDNDSLRAFDDKKKQLVKDIKEIYDVESQYHKLRDRIDSVEKGPVYTSGFEDLVRRDLLDEADSTISNLKKLSRLGYDGYNSDSEIASIRSSVDTAITRYTKESKRRAEVEKSAKKELSKMTKTKEADRFFDDRSKWYNLKREIDDLEALQKMDRYYTDQSNKQKDAARLKQAKKELEEAWNALTESGKAYADLVGGTIQDPYYADGAVRKAIYAKYDKIYK